MKFSDMRIGTRLSLAFGLLLCLLCSIALIGWQSLAANNRQVELIVGENNVTIAAANSMRGFLNQEARSVRNIILYEDPEIRREQKEIIIKTRKQYDDTFDKLRSLMDTKAERELAGELESDRNKVRPNFDKVMSLAEAGTEKDAALHLRSVVQAPQAKWFTDMQAMIDLQEKQNNESITQMRDEYQLILKILFGVAIAATALGISAAWYVTRSITAPLGEAVYVAQSVARGDLRSEINSTHKDETGILITALRTMNNNLAGIVCEVRSGTNMVATASSQIASGNLELSSRTEEQASSLEETASALEELTSTVKQNAENAKEASSLAMQARDIALRGGGVMGNVIEKMAGISASSEQIVDIISVIDGIAFQTNILALNAAVEAARAGEQGRGFAVVASEVRNLAQRSAAAAKEIKMLIDDSVNKVEDGSALVAQAGATMQEVVTSVQRVTNVIQEISTASNEQTEGISQINMAMAQMDQVTQQNAALVEEAAAAAGALEDQSAKLLHSVSIFKVKER
ncbi:methyl-accepting chemotaxis protein [Herbaspirillum camelliae]|uniref:methyl-accepting chemotaxis protein n=1 Tax=Herbaspirillum camelliae TaxID=1892903 RepID=UPI002D219067|nr:methyl-accepting chemotaxis protein [Herbaspirillum camelliae]